MKKFKIFSEVVWLAFNRTTPGCWLSGKVTQPPE